MNVRLGGAEGSCERAANLHDDDCNGDGGDVVIVGFITVSSLSFLALGYTCFQQPSVHEYVDLSLTGSNRLHAAGLLLRIKLTMLP